MKKVQFKSKYTPYLFVLPQILIILIFFIWPSSMALYYSFIMEDAFGVSSEFVWFQNYQDILSDSDYYASISFTMIFSLLVTLFSLSIGLLLAYKANNILRGKGLYRTLLMWPYAIAPAVVGLMASFFFNPSHGDIYNLLNKIGWAFDPKSDPFDAQVMLIFVATWKQISVNFIFFLSALQGIPKSIIEASMIDCKSGIKRFWTIVFPLLMPITFFLLITNITYSFFETFGIIDTTTRGTPMGETKTLAYKIYQDGFLGADIGGSSAQSVILMLFVLLLTVLQFKYIEKRIHY
ncbi:MAG TPA: ABC transporter permease subunit [Campylobacterales bacterium]|jgi:sn-glycerol 3-phosphate transport system permease protein|nr:ABC transporter permease subunit [Campylobacterales bacterium]